MQSELNKTCFSSRSWRPSLPRRIGFTLLEMLTSLAVISVLASVLLPSLAHAREQARLMECKTRLRNVGLGLAAYAGQNKERFPITQAPFGVGQTELLEALRRYVPDGRVFYCPSDERPEFGYSPQRFADGSIGYFYYSCREAAPYNSQTSKVLRNFGAPTPNWPRAIAAGMDEGTWVMSDRWISGENPHPFGKKGLNFLTLGLAVRTTSGAPANEFK